MASSEDSGRLRLLYDLACAFAARIDFDELVPVVVARCRDAFDAEGASIMLLDAEHQELFFYSTAEAPEVAARLEHVRFPANQGIAGAVLRTGKAARVDDAAAHPDFYSGVDRETGTTTRNMLCVPLRAENETVGVVQVVNRRGEAFTDADLGLLEAMAGSIAVALVNATVYEKTRASEEQLRAQVVALRRDLARRDRFSEIIGACPAMQEVFHLMESAASSPIAVLIEGETGTGKELVARGIHRASARAEGPFVAVNCAAIPEPLLERELFGHRRGAFTGATHDQSGLFNAADGGTILLDEIGEMPAAMQAKLLRVLQEGEVQPLGDSRPRRVDVRVISATNTDLLEAVEEKQFREDLYYRLGAFPISLPPLRERRQDIPLLVQHFLAAAADRHKKRIAGIEREALERIEVADWPGNVRELQNELDRAVALARDGGAIGAEDLSSRLAKQRGEPSAVKTRRPAEALAPLREARTAFETRYIADALEANGGNVSAAARALGLSRVMLQRKMKAYNLR